MKCEDCKLSDQTYYPNRCMHKSNVVYLDTSGMYCKKHQDELNPDGECEIGEHF